MALNKKKAVEKLVTLSWEELDWLEQKCRKLKESAEGPRVYRSSGDGIHREEAVISYIYSFSNPWDKHYGGNY